MSTRYMFAVALVVGVSSGCGPRGTFCSGLEDQLASNSCYDIVEFAGAEECRLTLRPACDAQDFRLLNDKLDCEREFGPTPPDCGGTDAYWECLDAVLEESDGCAAAKSRLYL